MQIKLLTTIAGTSGTFQEGEIVELPEDQSIALIQGGYAVLIKSDINYQDIKEELARMPDTEKAEKDLTKKEKASFFNWIRR
jgi:hypothetical protein